MPRRAFLDPNMRFAYVATKAGVFVIAAIATWPLARVIGPNAWIGLGVFGLVLTVLTVAVLSAGSTTVTKEAEDEDEPDPTQPFKIEVEDSIDLHSFPPRDVPDVVDAYLEEAVEKLTYSAGSVSVCLRSIISSHWILNASICFESRT